MQYMHADAPGASVITITSVSLIYSIEMRTLTVRLREMNNIMNIKKRIFTFVPVYPLLPFFQAQIALFFCVASEWRFKNVCIKLTAW